MDAANTSSLKKTAFFLTLALLLAAPFAAQAQTKFVFPNGQTMTANGTSYGCIDVNADSGTFSYNVAQQPTAGVIDPTLTFSPSSSGVNTGQQLCAAAGNIPGNVTPGSHSITVTLTPTNPASGISAVNVTVNWNPAGGGSGGGTNGNGATVNVNSIALNSSSSSGTFTLTSTVSTGQVAYSLSASYTGNASNWLSFSLSNPTTNPCSCLNPGNFQTFGVFANSSGLSNGTYNANVLISLTGAGSGTISIPVQFVVGGNGGGNNNGNLTANPNPVNLNYVTGSNNPPSQFVTLTSFTGASSYNASVTSGQGWLLANGQSQSFGLALSGGLSVTTILGNLPTSNSTGTIVVTDNNSNQVTITVNFTINGSSNGLTLSPSPLSLNAAVGQTTQASAILTVTSNTAGTLAVTGVSGTGLSTSLPNPNIAAGGTQTITVFGNPSGLAAGTYQGTITVTLNSTTSTSVNVNFVVGNSTGGSGVAVAPTSLQFNYEVNQSQPPQQYLYDSINGAYSTNGAPSWISVPSGGSGPGLITVIANPSGLAANATPYQGSFTVTTGAGTQTINVSLLVSNTTVVFAANASPAGGILQWTAGTANPTGTFQVLSSDNTSVALSASSSQSWLTVTPLNNPDNTPASFYVTANGSALSNGINVANVTITSNAANSQLTVPIVVNVTGSTSSGGTLTLGASSLTFNAQVNGAAPSSQNLSITASTSTSYTASATVSSGGTNWLSISPSGSLNTSSTSGLTVSVNQAGLAVGNYSGTITLSTSSGNQTVPVTLVVSSTGGGGSGSITVSPTSLPFTYSSGGTVPGAQGFNVTAVNGNGVSIGYTVAASTATGGNWLSVSQTSGFTPGAVNVSLNSSVVTALAAGTYTGTVTVTPNGGTAATVSVTLVVQGLPTVSASPSTINLTYQAGSANTPTSTIQVSGSQSGLNFTANASSAGWLQVSPTSGTVGPSGTALTVSVNPSGLSAGTYQGTVIVSAGSGATGSSTITVNLTVTAPLPTISAVQNAASGSGGPVSPGEIVSLFGTAMGPGTPVGLTLDANGNVSTTLGGVQVLFNGIPAPLTYVSATQINAVVPYGLAGLSFPFVQVKYLNQGSNSFTLNAASTAPGIFTQNGSGTGPGAILNSDFSVNGNVRPAAKGSTIQVYMTGEGQTSPPGITGSVTCPHGCTIQQIPVPLLPVTITFIDSTGARYPANYTFAGEAPGFVAGLMQVNVTVPNNVPSGTLQIIIGVGSNTSQAGVTVAIQ